MLSIFLSAIALVATTMWIHATGIAVLLRVFMKLRVRPPVRAWALILILLRMIWWLILLHLIEIAVWAFLYSWQGCLPNVEAAFYFSGTTYTSVGYGDLVLAKPWRLLGPLESLTGILMCGLSTGFFFVIVSRMYQSLSVETPAIK
jgi:Ion channel